MRRTGFCFIAAVTATLSLSGGVAAQRGPAVMRVAVVADGPSVGFRELAALIRQETVALFGDEVQLQYPEDPEEAEFTAESVRAALDRALSRNDVDVVVAFGPLAGRDIGSRASLPKPVIIPLAVPDMQGLPLEHGTSGRHNLAYVTGLVNTARDLGRFREVARFERVAAVIDAYVADAIVGLERHLAETSQELGITVQLVKVDPDPGRILAAIPDDAQAVYLGPLPRTTVEDQIELLSGLNARNLPTFASIGMRLVERGALATVTPEEDWMRRARRVALMIQRIQQGEDPSSFSVVFEPHEELVINMRTARVIEAWPPFELLTEARLIHEQRREVARTLTLDQAVREALERNLDLEATRTALRSGEEEVRRARAPLLPHLDIGAQGQVIDSDRAESPFARGQLTTSWSVTGTQLLFSEQAHTGLGVQRHLQESREQELRERRYDIMQEAAEAYLNVLRATTAERIQRENLQRTRRNLILSRVRREVGVGNPAEVYRWEIEIANNRRDVIRAVATRNQAEIQLNRVLNRPLEESFLVEETSPADTVLLIGDPRLDRFLDNPWSFRVFREFMAEEAVARSPELARIDAVLRAQERALVGRKRVLWAPTVALSAGVTHNFLDAGNGSDPPMLPMGFEGLLGDVDDFDMFVGIQISLPLYDGGARYADIRQSRLEISRLHTERQAVAQRVEQRVRSALHVAGASRPGIELSRSASDAARRNLDLVTDAYRQGAVDVVTLVDAQTQALVAELAAANAVFDFLIDYMRVERAAGCFSFDQEEADRADFFQRLVEFSAERRRAARAEQEGEAQ